MNSFRRLTANHNGAVKLNVLKNASHTKLKRDFFRLATIERILDMIPYLEIKLIIYF